MRYLIVLIAMLWPLAAGAQDWEDRQRFTGAAGGATLRVLSSTDTSVFAPLIEAFLKQQPGLDIEYFVTSTADLDRVFRATPDAFDVVISSAMDLQFKLANDGFAQRLDLQDSPTWARWRQTLFAFTTEPAAIVINRAAFAGFDLPATRQDLIAALRARPDTFQGKIATYDVRKSGLGYLIATQDARTSETYWRLMEVMGGLNAQLYCCSGQMIDDLATGKIAVAYNVLASYANARVDVADQIEIILPADFPTTMMRTALVSKHTDQPAAATAFLRHLISRRQDAQAQGIFPLPAFDTGPDDVSQSIIALEPALLTYLDRLKRAKFIRAWEDAVIQ